MTTDTTTSRRKAFDAVTKLTDTLSDRLVELENTFTHAGDDPTFSRFHSLLGDIDQLAVDAYNDLEECEESTLPIDPPYPETTVARDGTATPLGWTSEEAAAFDLNHERKYD